MWLQAVLALIPALPTVIGDVENAAKAVQANGWTKDDVQACMKSATDLIQILGAVAQKL